MAVSIHIVCLQVVSIYLINIIFQERKRVKYRIKSGGGRRVIDKAVAEVTAKLLMTFDWLFVNVLSTRLMLNAKFMNEAKTDL